ncbi:hypothetical protein ABIE77_003697 [Sinorhizobium fredii]
MTAATVPMRSSALMRLWACRALVAFALKRSMKLCRCLRARFVLGFRLHLQFFGFRLLPLELVIGAAIEGELLLVQVNDGVHRRIQQVAVVADDDDRMRIAADVILQPQGSFEIQIVGRLVEQQQIRLGKQHGCKRNAHAPAAGEGGGGTLLRFVIEAEPGENARRPRFRRMGADIGKPRLDVGNPMRVGGDFGLGEKGGAFLVGLQHDLDQRLFRARRLLSHLADPRVLRQGDAASLGGEFADDDPEERRFAGTVAADEARLRARRKRHGCGFDEKTARDAGGKTGDLDHCGLLPGVLSDGKGHWMSVAAAP